MGKRIVSVYRNSFDTVGVTATLDAVIQRIQTGKNGFSRKDTILQRPCHHRANEIQEIQGKGTARSNLFWHISPRQTKGTTPFRA